MGFIKGINSLTIKTRIALFFGILISLVIVNYCLITLANANLRIDGAKVEISRRNLNLVNEVSFHAAAIVEGNAAFIQPLSEHIAEVDEYIGLLNKGGEVVIRSTEIDLPPLDASVIPQLLLFKSNWEKYKKHLNLIAGEARSGKHQSEEAKAALGSIYERNGLINKEVLELCDQTIDAYIATQTRIHTIIFILTLFNIAGLLAGYFFIRKILILPIHRIRKTAEHLADGSLDIKIGTTSQDEIGRLSQAIDRVVLSLTKTAEFAGEIGDGDFSSEFHLAGENDKLGKALLHMRENLKKVAEQDKIRYWSNEGMAKFGEILRNDHGNLKVLSYEIISQLVKYIGVNQGALFTMEEIDGERVLEMQACYAYDRQKFLKKIISMGEGMAGQAALEQETIYMTEVPDSYATITSGLGHSRPRSILIVPLKVNDEIYGVLELASLTRIESHKIEFVEKISENVASSLSSSKVNEQTKRLLEESQGLTEQMQAQEEEMRQNMEELQATQEEMARKQRDLAKNENLFRQLTDNVPGVIYQFCLDPVSGKGSFTYASKASMQLLGIRAEELVNAIDFRSVLKVHPDDTDSFQQNLQASAMSMGFFSWDGRLQRSTGEYIWVNASSSPDRQPDGTILWSGIITDISRKMELEELLKHR